MWEIMLLTLIKSHSISWGLYKQRDFSKKEKNSASSLQYKNSVWVFNLLTCFIDFGVNTATLTWISRLQPFLTDFTLANCHNCVSQLLNSIKCVYTRSYICIYTHTYLCIYLYRCPLVSAGRIPTFVHTQGLQVLQCALWNSRTWKVSTPCMEVLYQTNPIFSICFDLWMWNLLIKRADCIYRKKKKKSPHISRRVSFKPMLSRVSQLYIYTTPYCFISLEN